eukprot:10913913-Ditylum_brightwellii.AAC.1
METPPLSNLSTAIIPTSLQHSTICQTSKDNTTPTDRSQTVQQKPTHSSNAPPPTCTPEEGTAADGNTNSP